MASDSIINVTLLGQLAVLAYLAGGLLLAMGMYRDRAPLKAAGLMAGVAAAALHGAATGMQTAALGGLDANLFSTLALVSLLIVVILLLASLRFAVTEILIVALPGAALTLVVQFLVAPEPRALQVESTLMEVHVLSSLLAFSLLSIAALNAILISVEHRVLSRLRGIGLLQVLPPLAVMERLLFQLVWAGWLVLTLALATGLVFLDDLLGQHLAHKTALSILAWLVFGLLLAGRWRFGWRGIRAVRLTLIGMAILLLAYFGSKAVLELVLDRSWHTPE